MTADRLREIVEAHRICGEKEIDCADGRVAHEQRGELLDLLRAVAETSPIVNVIQNGVCEMCGRIIESHSKHPPEGHGPACPAPVLEALTPPASSPA